MMHADFTYLLLFFFTDIASAHKLCAMPGGNAGECRRLTECKPLNELNSKRVKTKQELLYIQESNCGITSSFKLSVCCPSETVWNTFKNFIPHLFKEIVDYETVLNGKDDKISDKNLTTKHGDQKVGGQKKRKPKSYDKESASIMECGIDLSLLGRVIGGEFVAPDKYPWLVLLEYGMNETLCGGSLITKRYVLTAAHCIERAIKPKFARLSEYNTTTYPTDYVKVENRIVNITVERISIEKNIAHPNYSRRYIHHDIGLSKLSRDPVLGDYINVICLPERDHRKDFHDRSVKLTVAGWGHDGKAPSDVKKHVKVPFVNSQRCQMLYAFRGILPSQICAGGKVGEDSCSGDSGGPLMYSSGYTYTVIGIVSYGATLCGTKDIPGVYTYVYSYLDWLQDNMD